MRITNTSQRTELASNAKAARRYWPRLIGLLGRGSLAPGEGLLIEPCRSVHTMFMRFTIDVVYVDRAMTVIKTVPDLKPFRASGSLKGAYAVVELPSGTIARSNTSAGDQLAIEETSRGGDLPR